MKILVTGSKGFIGKRLVKALEKKGHNVIGFDRSNNEDILNLEQVKKAVQGKDAVYHLAASLKEDDPLLLSVNVSGTKNVLEACSNARIDHFIFLSTVGVMGDIKKIADETTSFNPKTPYEISKAKAEKLVLTYQEVLPLTVVRSALVMGPNKEWEKIIKLIKNDFPLIGDGKNYWQTVFVDDLVEALVFLLDKQDALGETFIVAQQETITLFELVKLIRKELGLSDTVKKIPKWLGKVLGFLILIHKNFFGTKFYLTPEHIKRLVRNRHYSIEKIAELGWRPRYLTKDAVIKTVKELEKY